MPRFKVGGIVVVIKESYSHSKGGSSHSPKIGSRFTLKEWREVGRFWRTNEGPDFYEHEIEPSVNPDEDYDESDYRESDV